MPGTDDNTSFDELLRRRSEVDSRLARYKQECAVMFADIAGSTSFYERRGDLSGIAMVHQLVDRARETAQPLGGHFVKSIGDAVLLYFREPAPAVRAAVRLQQKFSEFNRPRSPADYIHLRIGVSWGSGFVKDDDLYGDVVNLAARLEELARPGQIIISAALHSAARQVSDLRRLQDAELRGKAAPQEVYEVLWSGAPAPEEKPAALTRSYSLVLLEPGAGTTTIFALKQAETLLGRDRGEIRFPKDPMISSAHARFRVDAEGLEMEDLSASGVFLRLRQPARLQHGDLFLVGKKLFEFLAGDTPGQAQLRLSHRDLSLREPETVIGRREGNLVFPDDPLLSGRHACLRREGDAFYLEDLKSTNGTFLKVRGKARLADGDEVLCGSKLLRVRVAEEPIGIR